MLYVYRPDARRDHAFRVRDGKLVDEAQKVSGAAYERAWHATGYHGLDAFTRSRAGMDVTRQNLEDPMHIVTNNVHHVLSLVLDVGPEAFTMKKRMCEVKLQRFPELAPRKLGRYVLYV